MGLPTVPAHFYDDYFQAIALSYWYNLIAWKIFPRNSTLTKLCILHKHVPHSRAEENDRCFAGVNASTYRPSRVFTQQRDLRFCCQPDHQRRSQSTPCSGPTGSTSSEFGRNHRKWVVSFISLCSHQKESGISPFYACWDTALRLARQVPA